MSSQNSENMDVEKELEKTGPIGWSISQNSKCGRLFKAARKRRKTPYEGANTLEWISEQQIDDRFNVKFRRKMHIKESLIPRLGLEKELEGHSGCVNCLEWNASGSLLASGSDDCQIIIWEPMQYKKAHVLQSGHQGNIFSVKFLPHTNDTTLVSGAADCCIRVHDISDSHTTPNTIMVCSCHSSRVKRIATAPNDPHMFWSAGEDGLIMEFDMRQKHQCSKICKNVLINLMTYIGATAEAKCLAINALRPEQLAVGSNDAYIRLYDRRMIKTISYKHRPESAFSSARNWDRQSSDGQSNENDDDGGSKPNLSHNCVKYFTPGHLPRSDLRRNYRTLACTYLSFSPEGSELLANLGGEQIYLFDVLKPEKPKSFDTGQNGHCRVKYPSGYRNGTTTIPYGAHKVHKVDGALPHGIEALKKKANERFEAREYSFAINLYNVALGVCPNGAVLYGNRAAAFMKRGWDGDLYCALRDCMTALQLDPDFFKAHYRLCRCFFELHWNTEASECLKSLKLKYPDHSQSHPCIVLERDITKAINKASSKCSHGTDSCGGKTCNRCNEGSEDSKDENTPWENSELISQEREWRLMSWDFKQRFCGHCNTTTDIKEANFFGSEGQYIVAGSDDGSFFTWDRKTTNIVKILNGDESIVNCLQPHPTFSLLATSGIDPVVRLWSPRPEDGQPDRRERLESVETVAANNQRRMMANPLETMLINMGYRYPNNYDSQEQDQQRTGGQADILQCRTS